jgi:hypothetical protein
MRSVMFISYCLHDWQTLFIISFSSFWTVNREKKYILDRQQIASQWCLQLIFRMHNSDPTRINIKWCLVSTTFKIYLDILSNLYITFTIFYYNTISLKGTFFSCSSYRTLSNRIIQFTCNAVNTHLKEQVQHSIEQS